MTEWNVDNYDLLGLIDLLDLLAKIEIELKAHHGHEFEELLKEIKQTLDSYGGE